jgi:hypothetical protein
MTDLEDYLIAMEKQGEWGDGILLSAAVSLYEGPFVIITPVRHCSWASLTTITMSGFTRQKNL